MSGFLLDTNVPSEIIRSYPDPGVAAWISTQVNAELNLSVVTIGEFRKGITTLPDSRKRSRLEDWLANEIIPVFGDRILPVTTAIAQKWGALAGMRQLRGRPLSMADGLIAATALEHGLVLVTRNVRDFDDLGVELFSPWGNV
jgi:predicted nucleic acid-binding protein